MLNYFKKTKLWHAIVEAMKSEIEEDVRKAVDYAKRIEQHSNMIEGLLKDQVMIATDVHFKLVTPQYGARGQKCVIF